MHRVLIDESVCGGRSRTDKVTDTPVAGKPGHTGTKPSWEAGSGPDTCCGIIHSRQLGQRRADRSHLDVSGASSPGYGDKKKWSLNLRVETGLK